MSGFVERVIEDWLTKASERAFQLPFAAYLARNGHTIKYVSPHSSLEHGKDLVTVTGRITHAYQLKAGSVDQALWRQIEGEVLQASTIPIEVPGMAVRIPNRAYLVLSGQVTDPVRNAISLKNVDLASRGEAIIELIQLKELVDGFTQVFESFCPQAIEPLSDLVRLYLRNGRGPQDKVLLATVFGKIAGKPSRVREAERALSNVVVAAEFAAAPFRLRNNHIGVIDTWVIAAAIILRSARRQSLLPRYWQSSFGLCKEAITRAGEQLLAEMLERNDFSEPPLLADSEFIRVRKLVVLGYAAAVINARKIFGQPIRGDSDRLLKKFMQEPQTAIWGESSWNYELNISLAVRSSVLGSRLGEQMAEQWLRFTCPRQSDQIPHDPYWSVADAVSPAKRREEEARGRFERMRLSYTAGSALSYLARRMLRQTVTPLWPAISRYDFASMIPTEDSSELDWLVTSGILEMRVNPYTQSWRRLRQRAFSERSSLFEGESWLLPYFLCTYDHRTTPALSGELDYLTSDDAFKAEWERARDDG